MHQPLQSVDDDWEDFSGAPRPQPSLFRCAMGNSGPTSYDWGQAAEVDEGFDTRLAFLHLIRLRQLTEIQTC